MALNSLEERIKHWPSITEDLSAIVVDFYRWMAYKRSLSPYTVVNYMSDLRTFFTFMCEHRGEKVHFEMLKDLPIQDLRSFLAHRVEQGIHKRSSARGFSALSTFCLFLSERDTPVDMPVALLARPSLGKTVPRQVPTSRILGILSQRQESWSDTRDIAALALLYGSGLRISEALSLSVQDWPAVWTKDCLLSIQGKGSRNRYVPVLECVHRLVEAYREICPYKGEGNAPLFFGERGGRLNPEVLQARVRMIRRAANLAENSLPHNLRQNSETDLIENGGQLQDIQELLGYRALSSKQAYTQVSQKHMMDVLSKVNVVGG